MKKLMVILCVMAFPILAAAQKNQKDTAKVNIPLKDGTIFYEQIIDSILNQKQDLVFNNSLKWMANSFVDSKDVIQINDKSAGLIVGKGVFDLKLPGFVGTTYRISFRIDITAKENKSRIRFYQFAYKFLGTSTVDEYRSLDERYIKYKNGTTVLPGDDRKCFTLLNEKVNMLINSYRNFIKTSKLDDF